MRRKSYFLHMRERDDFARWTHIHTSMKTEEFSIKNMSNTIDCHIYCQFNVSWENFRQPIFLKEKRRKISYDIMSHKMVFRRKGRHYFTTMKSDLYITHTYTTLKWQISRLWHDRMNRRANERKGVEFSTHKI